MSEERTVSYSLDEIQKKIAKGDDRTDWKRVDALTDEDIDRATRDDPDWAGFEDIDWSKAEVVFPTPKQSISIRVDQDVVDFFKATGKGYQTRMNAVLRHYVHEQKKAAGLSVVTPFAPASGKFVALQHHQKLCFCNLSATQRRCKNISEGSN